MSPRVKPKKVLTPGSFNLKEKSRKVGRPKKQVIRIGTDRKLNYHKQG